MARFADKSMTASVRVRAIPLAEASLFMAKLGIHPTSRSDLVAKCVEIVSNSYEGPRLTIDEACYILDKDYPVRSQWGTEAVAATKITDPDERRAAYRRETQMRASALEKRKQQIDYDKIAKAEELRAAGKMAFVDGVSLQCLKAREDGQFLWNVTFESPQDYIRYKRGMGLTIDGDANLFVFSQEESRTGGIQLLERADGRNVSLGAMGIQEWLTWVEAGRPADWAGPKPADEEEDAGEFGLPKSPSGKMFGTIPLGQNLNKRSDPNG